MCFVHILKPYSLIQGLRSFQSNKLLTKSYIITSVVKPYTRYELNNHKRVQCYSLLKVYNQQKFLNSNIMNFSNESQAPKLSKKDQFKKAIKEYGSTVIIFHVAISLVSLGLFYSLVTLGVDFDALVSKLGIQQNFAASAGTFVTAYAIHKVFAPVRLSITITSTPFIVRYLRNKGILKKP